MIFILSHMCPNPREEVSNLASSCVQVVHQKKACRHCGKERRVGHGLRPRPWHKTVVEPRPTPRPFARPWAVSARNGAQRLLPRSRPWAWPDRGQTVARPWPTSFGRGLVISPPFLTPFSRAFSLFRSRFIQIISNLNKHKMCINIALNTQE